MSVNNRTRRKWNQVLLFLVSCHFVKYSISSPIFSSQFSQFQSARNLRNLPCVVRKSGLKGVCMFAIDCIKSNGTHLGTCIDKFYFGSCCQVKDIDSIYSPDLDDNTIDSNYPSPSSFDNKNSISEKRPAASTSTVSSTSPSSTVHFSTSNYKTTSSLKPAINYNNKTFELITTHASTSATRRPATRRTTSATEKYSVNAGGFTTTLGNIIERNTSTTIKLKDDHPSSTTESIKLTTFQSIGESIKNETLSSASITVQKVKPTRTTVVTKKPVPNRPSGQTTESPPLTTSARPSRRPGTTSKPTKNATTTVIRTTRKPVASTTIAVNRRTTITRRNSTLTSTRKPSTTAARPSTTEPQLTTISFVQTTKAPRPKPKPTSSIVKVEPSTITEDESAFTTTFSVVSANEKTSSSTTSHQQETTTKTPMIKTSTVKSTLVTRRPITTQASATSTQASTLNKRPITESTFATTTQKPSTISEKDELTSSKLNLTTPITSTSSEGLITWTLGLGNDVTDNVTKETPTTTPISQTTQSTSSSSQLPLNETLPVSIPDETTVSPLAIENSTYSSVDSDKEYMNATTISSVPSSSTHMSLEGVDYKQICGRRMFPEARIVGGAKAAFGRWPWQISLRQWRTSTYLHKCGSALLNENWAVSAAHCVDNVPPSDLLLRLGEYDLSIEEEPYGYQERRVQIVASHPQFDPRTFEYDLALLRFYEPVVFQPNIIPVCVPENDEDFIGRTAYVTGWGRLYEDGPLPSVLQEVTVPVIKNDICEAMYRSAGYIEHIPNIFICAGWQKGGHDSCEGDSGGPMVIQRTDKRFQLAGIISWGIGCAEPNQPGVYTRISEFRDWINQILMF